MSTEAIKLDAVKSTKVRAVREPGYANVWCLVDDATGVGIAEMRVSNQAGAWAKRIADALNAQLDK